MKVLNKKEQVFDIQLTPYGRHKLSAGNFNPVYYAFFDDNIIYDLQYGGGAEGQNETHNRIKNETQYLGTQASFEERLADSVTRGGILQDTIYENELNPLTSFGSIGDARLLAEESNVAAAWKLITMIGDNGQIRTHFGQLSDKPLSANTTDVERAEAPITQIDITSSYILSSAEPYSIANSFQSFREVIDSTNPFSDGRVVRLEAKNPLVYFEELNTELLTKNFDIEVFKVVDDDFQKLSFKSNKPQIVDGMMVSAQKQQNLAELDSNSVEYYFQVLVDQDIDSNIACKYVNQFNTDNYLIDLDHDCETVDDEDVYFDIYGRVTESEICQN